VWQLGLDPRRLVFIDETWATTNLIRRYGRCPRDQRLVAKVPHGHWKTTTFLAALRHDGLYAPRVIDGAITGDLFRAYVQQQLVSTLQPGDLVILDNLSAHKVSGIRSGIEAAQARVVYLPPYSPDLNPIEQVFAKLRRLLQTAAERTITNLWRRIGACVDLFTPQECTNYLRHAGYRYA
jgi:transposase